MKKSSLLRRLSTDLSSKCPHHSREPLLTVILFFSSLGRHVLVRGDFSLESTDLPRVIFRQIELMSPDSFRLLRPAIHSPVFPSIDSLFLSFREHSASAFSWERASFSGLCLQRSMTLGGDILLFNGSSEKWFVTFFEIDVVFPPPPPTPTPPPPPTPLPPPPPPQSAPLSLFLIGSPPPLFRAPIGFLVPWSPAPPPRRCLIAEEASSAGGFSK